MPLCFYCKLSYKSLDSKFYKNHIEKYHHQHLKTHFPDEFSHLNINSINFKRGSSNLKSNDLLTDPSSEINKPFNKKKQLFMIKISLVVIVDIYLNLTGLVLLSMSLHVKKIKKKKL